MAKTRIESDNLGKIKVPTECYWGAQTERAKINFQIGAELMPLEIIHALALTKKAAAIVNSSINTLSKYKANLIVRACNDIINNKLSDNFPLVIWQSGSATQTNMNINEVIANRAIKISRGKIGSKKPIHPNDDVNMSQSTNDVFPTAMHIATTVAIVRKLLPNLKLLHKELNSLNKKFRKTLKIGRTHLQDAVPITLGQEFFGYAAQLDLAIKNIKNSLPFLQELAIGGTAVGTGLNAPKQFDKKMAIELTKLTGLKFKAATNKFSLLASHDAMLIISSALKTLATILFKMANDIRWLASGPNCGLGELILPANEHGSSIMPGKVNPTQCEALQMVCTQVIGNDSTVSFANSQGNLELNTFKPVIIYNVLQSIKLLSDACTSFRLNALKGIKANYKKIDEYLSKSLMLVTVLNPIIGYDKSYKIVDYASRNNVSLREACKKLNYMTTKEFDRIVAKYLL